jgi:uncharacterized membrane protein YeaQ/YmgE (transglycosylase-associated protein family)
MFIVMLVSWLLFGLIVGLVARAVFPGTQSMGLLGTAGLGIAGSFVGGILGNLFHGGPLMTAQPSGWIGSIIGALIVIGALGAIGRRASV